MTPVLEGRSLIGTLKGALVEPLVFGSQGPCREPKEALEPRIEAICKKQPVLYSILKGGGSKTGT